MLLLPSQELENFFSANNNQVLTSEGLFVKMEAEENFCISAIIEKDEEQKTKYSLYDEVKGVKEFIDAYNFRSIEDLQQLSKDLLWVRYLFKEAEIKYTRADSKRICFRLHRRKTMVYSKDLAWYSEVPYPMKKLEDVKGYVREISEPEFYLIL